MDTRSVVASLSAPDDVPREVRREMLAGSGGVCRHEGRLYLRLGDLVLSCPDDEAGRALILSAGGRKGSSSAPPRTKEECFALLLQEPFVPESLADACVRMGIRRSSTRCVILFCLDGFPDRELASFLRDIVPLEQEEVIVPVDYRQAALVKDAADLTEEDLIEFASAALFSLEAEGYPGIRAGVGKRFEDLGDARESFRQAEEALRLGRGTRGGSPVFCYDRMTLQRVLDCIPEETRERMRQVFFQTGSGAALDEEILETVRVFFLHDLNLTAASKQLFIHRNTLNYRLDKIRKATGLDVRKFEDAVVYMIVFGHSPEE